MMLTLLVEKRNRSSPLSFRFIHDPHNIEETRQQLQAKVEDPDSETCQVGEHPRGTLAWEQQDISV